MRTIDPRVVLIGDGKWEAAALDRIYLASGAEPLVVSKIRTVEEWSTVAQAVSSARLVCAWIDAERWDGDYLIGLAVGCGRRMLVGTRDDAAHEAMMASSSWFPGEGVNIYNDIEEFLGVVVESAEKILRGGYEWSSN